MARQKKKKRGGFFSFVLTLMILVVGCIFGYCVYQLAPKLIEYQVSDQTFKRIRDDAVSEYKPAEKLLETESESEIAQTEAETEPQTEPPDLSNALHIDWESLRGTDCVGWLQMDKISYPIMHNQSNDKYLHHLPDGSYNYGGSLFLYNKNNPMFTDRSSFIYGHNMANGSMFGTLKEYVTADHMDTMFYIYLPDGTRKDYMFYSVQTVEANSDLYLYSFASDESFMKWQESVKASSFYANSPVPNVDAHYVTLSTCNGYSGTTHRLVVVGQLMHTYKLQEAASWYDDYLERYSDVVPSKREAAMRIRAKAETFEADRRDWLRRRHTGDTSAEMPMPPQPETEAPEMALVEGDDSG